MASYIIQLKVMKPTMMDILLLTTLKKKKNLFQSSTFNPYQQYQYNINTKRFLNHIFLQKNWSVYNIYQENPY